MNKKLLKKYNISNSLLVISGYPKKRQTYSQGVCAVSSFTKNTLSALKEENLNRKIIVLTMVIDKEEIYEENGMLIVRCFKRNTPLSYFGLIKEILTFNKVKDVLIEFEFASFGNTLMTGLLAPVVWFIRLTGKNIVLVSHQVVSDISVLSGHIGLSPKNPLTKFLNYSLKWFYKAICLPASKVIVLEEEFKTRLGELINKDKISVIPHGIDTNISSVRGGNARKSLGIKKDEFVVLYFGYLTWYKGIDFLINALGNVSSIKGRKIKLVVAGGPSFTQESKPHYQKFIKKVNRELSLAKNTVSTGFVQEQDMNSIFEMADLTVFPYRTFMSSSGPLSLAISHNKPFIISENLSGLIRSLDIKKALAMADLDQNDIIFKLNKRSLVKAIANSMNPKAQAKMIEMSKILNTQRSFKNTAKKYEEILTPAFKAEKVSLSFPYSAPQR